MQTLNMHVLLSDDIAVTICDCELKTWGLIGKNEGPSQEEEGNSRKTGS